MLFIKINFYKIMKTKPESREEPGKKHKIPFITLLSN